MSDIIGSIGPEEIGGGFAPDMPPTSPPVFDTGQNVNFTQLSIQPIAGQFVLVASEQILEPITGLRTTVIDGVRKAFIGTPTRLLLYDNGLLSELNTGFHGTLNDLWTIERWGNWLIATNGQSDPVQVFKTALFEPLTIQTFDRADILVRSPSEPFLLAFGTSGGTEGGFGVMHWCARDDIEDWETTASNFAGSLPIRDLSGPVLAALTAGGVVPFFTTDEFYIASYIRFPFVFGVTKVSSGIGVLGRKAVASVGSTLFGIGPRGAWTSDLAGNYRYFDVPLVRELLIKRLDGANGHLATVWHNMAEHSVVFFIPSLETEEVLGNDRGFAYNYLDNNWTILGYGRSVVDDTGIFPYAVTGDVLGNIFYQAASGQLPTADTLPKSGVPGSLVMGPEDIPMRVGYGVGGYGSFRYGGPQDVQYSL